MYDYYRVCSSMPLAPMMQRPPVISPGQLFQMFSMALDRNLNEYCRKKIQNEAQIQAKALLNLSQVKKAETIVIDSQSDQEPQRQIFISQKEGDLKILKGASTQLCLMEAEHKELAFGSKQTQGPSQSFSDISKEHLLKENEELEKKNIIAKQIKKLPIENTFVEFSIECPKIGICNAQLLKKKQGLLMRKVVDWSQVPQTGPKQRREIRMLKN